MLLLISAYLPVAILIYLMTKKHSVAASKALPLSALIAYLVVLFVFDFELRLVNASVISGLLLALTPIMIIAGAIFLFRCMEVTGALGIIRSWLNRISSNSIAQLMVVGWAFAFLIEGASGFGTPAAIAAPILVGLGFPALRVAIACLVFNTIPVTFGAVGTPIWFGLALTELTPVLLQDVAWKSALINSVAAPFIVMAALALVVEKKIQLKQNWLFIVLSTFSCTLPYLMLSQVSVEFPSLVGGFIGLIITLLLAKYNIGLHQRQNDRHCSVQIPVQVSMPILLKASFPLWGTILLLVVTRIPELGIKNLLQLTSPAWGISAGPLGDVSISASLVVKLERILQTPISWQHNTLYVPSILPFVVLGCLTLWLFKSSSFANVVSHTKNSMKKPVIALFGALVFVNMMMLTEEYSAVSLIGRHLAGISGQYWGFFAPFLGALGSFFSGSATISNLTFAGVQQTIASDLQLNVTTILALQSVGAAMGNMICINNIVAVTSILALQNSEGYILKRSILVLLLYGLIAGTMGMVLA
ncbi:lactate transporter, LctP family [Paraglaciecola mesophila KMM 241]|uniref:L-lactate permease n=1 Tax=Paraglaciecola mesophila KMM 241 TaxID=1128912 RepID=K6Z9N7_9ALTE|nr:L-lactate permease [Paraglaciecola mesophila]GAC25693.1 lactate transporter, LctP family [Paraglaciecola mesophila KMM 241]